MASSKVIVFGPTGQVGSATARTAAQLGATVVLAMRDTAKAIPGLDAETENHGNYERVNADLNQPDTIRDAVATTRAKWAFIYLVRGSNDSMRSTAEALKSAGIEFVVFLSSFLVHGDLRAIPPANIIPYSHAQVEANFIDVFGADKFVAARPGYFASNAMQYKAEVEKGVVKLYAPDVLVDCIVPEDIGRVCGTVLAKGPQNGQKPIYLFGPELMSQTDFITTLMKTLGREVKIEILATPQEAEKHYIEMRGIPPPIAKYMIRQLGESERDSKGQSSGSKQLFNVPLNEEDLSNVQKYSGHKATSFEEWVEQNRHAFA